MKRPNWQTYFLGMTDYIATRSNCSRRAFGAVIVDKENQIVTTGYNGTPKGVKNCFDGGCARCESGIEAGEDYDACGCVHSEANAITQAGYSRTSGATLYVSGRPCFFCLKMIIQARIMRVVYYDDGPMIQDEKVEKEYWSMVGQVGLVMVDVIR